MITATSLRVWKFRLMACLVGLGAPIAGAQATNVHEDAVICFNCSYQQAVEYAKERVTPRIICGELANPQGTYAEPKCSSQPREVVVYDGIRKQGYGFRLSHSTLAEGAGRRRLQIEERPVAPEISTQVTRTGEDTGRIARSDTVFESFYARSVMVCIQCSMNGAKSNEDTRRYLLQLIVDTSAAKLDRLQQQASR